MKCLRIRTYVTEHFFLEESRTETHAVGVKHEHHEADICCEVSTGFDYATEDFFIEPPCARWWLHRFGESAHLYTAYSYQIRILFVVTLLHVKRLNCSLARHSFARTNGSRISRIRFTFLFFLSWNSYFVFIQVAFFEGGERRGFQIGSMPL